ncbi:hypothetical protein TWF696_001451 [Orbilia brochopaga]|uniref:Uncharacterized protein n=1 Tax=Orbilia brochopaga TaxID=3140254 RepID=A0AAV9UC90_9PEZI
MDSDIASLMSCSKNLNQAYSSYLCNSLQVEYKGKHLVSEFGVFEPYKLFWIKDKHLQQVRHFRCINFGDANVKACDEKLELQIYPLIKRLCCESLLSFDWDTALDIAPSFFYSFICECKNLQNLSFPLEAHDHRLCGHSRPMAPIWARKLPHLKKLRVFRVRLAVDGILAVGQMIAGAQNLECFSIEGEPEAYCRLHKLPAQRVKLSQAETYIVNKRGLGTVKDMKSLLRKVIYEALSLKKSLRCLQIANLPLDPAVNACLKGCELRELTLKDVENIPEIAEALINHRFRLRKLHLMVSYKDLRWVRRMLVNMHLGLEELILLTRIVQTEEIVSEVKGSLGEQREYLIDGELIARQSATLKALAMHDMVGEEMLWMSSNFPLVEKLSGSSLIEYSCTIGFTFDSTNQRPTSLGLVLDEIRDCIEILYLVPKTLSESKMRLRIASAFEVCIQDLLIDAYHDAIERPVLKYVVFGMWSDWLFRVNWAPNTSGRLPYEPLWLPTVQNCRLAENYDLLNGGKFRLYEASFMTDRLTNRLPAFRLGY